MGILCGNRQRKIQKLSKVTPYTGCAAGAPAVIVPVYHTEGLVAPSFAQIDMSIAQENIWLETDTLGLGGVWFGIAPVEEHMEKVHRLLDLPENVKVFPCLHWVIRQKQDLSRIGFIQTEFTLSKNKIKN